MSPSRLAEIAVCYIDRSLPPADRLRFLVRLLTCRTLRRYVAGLRSLAPLVGHAPRVPPPPEAARRILRFFRGWDPDRRRSGAPPDGRLVA
ncbi:MAG: hypothetical protein L0323_13185 [Planctomycetes bacterium]|nr:hypothetical protein [Planctomycetota bacterium]